MKNKYKDNESVYIKKYKTNGIIVESSRYFKEINPLTNQFKEEGHAVIENTLNDFRTSYELIGDTLIVNMPEEYYGEDAGFSDPFKIQYKNQNIVYTVEVPNFGGAVFFENELSKPKKGIN